MTLADLAARVGCRLEGDGSLEITRAARIEDAGPGDLTFLANPRYASKATAASRSRGSRASKMPAPGI